MANSPNLTLFVLVLIAVGMLMTAIPSAVALSPAEPRAASVVISDFYDFQSSGREVVVTVPPGKRFRLQRLISVSAGIVNVYVQDTAGTQELISITAGSASGQPERAEFGPGYVLEAGEALVVQENFPANGRIVWTGTLQ